MANQAEPNLEAGPEQIRYAAILEKGMYFGLLILFITFAIYTLGIMKPHIPLNEISKYWGLNVHDYLEATQTKAGWSWVGMLQYGDFINFIGVAILAGISIICYLAIVPILLRNKDTVFAVIAILEVLVLVFAASGIVAVGH